MSTRLRLSRDYPYGVAAFAAALADPDFHRAKLDTGSLHRAEVIAFRRDEAAGTVEVTVRQPVPPGQLPSVVERLLAGALVLERTERWTLTPDVCRGEADVVVPMAPVGAGGTMEVVGVAGAAPTCRLAVDLEVTAYVPLLGSSIERQVVAGVRGLTGSEHDRISAWLERARGTA